MANTPALAKEGDIKRAVAAVVKAGLEVQCVEIDIDGRIRVVTNEQSQTVKSDWD